MNSHSLGSGQTTHSAEGFLCRASGSPDNRTILDFGPMPVADRLLNEEELNEEDPLFPLHLVFCPESALVQITHDVPPDLLWGGDYPYYTSVNPTLVQHFTEAAEEVMARKSLGADSLVLEVASNDGYQLEVFRRAGAQVLGVDPAKGPSEVAIEKGIDTRIRLFDKACVDDLVDEGVRADVISANNLINLIPDPVEFVQGLDRLLQPDGLVLLETPYFVDTVDKVAFDNVFHQNTTYWTASSLQRLFGRVGLEMVDVKRISTFGGSLRVIFERGGRPSNAVEDLLRSEQDRGVDQFAFYEAFAAKAQHIRETLRSRILKARDDGQRVVAYGAAGGMATTLLSFLQLPEGALEYAVDLSPHKHGRWTSGYRLKIYPPEKLDEDVPEFALLLAWNFEPQVLAQRQIYRDRGGKFLVPIPAVREA